MFTLFLTLDGILIYNSKFNFWDHKYKFLNSHDRALWKAQIDNQKIYFASSSGVIICDYMIIDNNLQIYNDKESWLPVFDHPK